MNDNTQPQKTALDFIIALERRQLKAHEHEAEVLSQDPAQHPRVADCFYIEQEETGMIDGFYSIRLEKHWTVKDAYKQARRTARGWSRDYPGLTHTIRWRPSSQVVESLQRRLWLNEFSGDTRKLIARLYSKAGA